MKYELKCLCGSSLEVGEEEILGQISCPFCGKNHYLSELNKQLYDLVVERDRSEFDVQNDTLLSYEGNGGRVLIPTSVVAIADNAFLHTNVEVVVLPPSVRSVGDNAFSGCYSLKEVQMAQGLKSIGNGAFSGCERLSVIELPSSVESVGEEAFVGCSGLTRVSLLGSEELTVGANAFEGCKSLRKVEIGNGATIGERAFIDCESLDSVYAKGVVRFDDFVFSRCKKATLYMSEKKGLSTPKWFNPKCLDAKTKVVWNYNK